MSEKQTNQDRAIQGIMLLANAEQGNTPASQILQDVVAHLKEIAPERRHQILCDAVLTLKSVPELIRSEPDIARGLMADMTKLLPLETPVFTSDDVSAHKRENYDSVYTLVIFFNENADEKTREAVVHMACKKGWSPERLANHWAKNPLGEDHQWESHKRRVMLPYFVKAFADVANDDERAPATRLAAAHAIEKMEEKIGRLRPDLFENLSVNAIA